MTEPLASLSDAASSYGVHYDTFRKAWRTYMAVEGFPGPVRDRAPYRWRSASLEAWQARREAENTAAILKAATDPGAPANENDRDTARPSARRVDRERGAVLALMQRASAQAARDRVPSDSPRSSA